MRRTKLKTAVNQQEAEYQTERHSGRSPAAQQLQNTPLMQRKAQSNAATMGSASSAMNKTGIPTALKTGAEQLTGFNLDGVKVHYQSAKPAAVAAHAYTQGNDIHLAAGQEKYLPHELMHVVQQMQGRVKPTAHIGNVALNDDPALEKEADTMAVKALKASRAGASEGTEVAQMAASHNQQSMRQTGAVVQCGGGLFTEIARKLPYMDESTKETMDPRRWRMNPYWWFYNQAETNFEMQHGGPHMLNGTYVAAQKGGYHTRERHGAEHPLNNIYNRTQAKAGGPLTKTGDSQMMHLGQNVRGFKNMPSGRFSTPAWHMYSLNKAKQHVEASYPGVSWPAGTAPFPPPGSTHFKTAKFTIEYQQSQAGISIDKNFSVSRAHFVLSTVVIDTNTNQAWFVQHFPKTNAEASPTIPNATVSYEQIPWLSTSP